MNRVGLWRTGLRYTGVALLAGVSSVVALAAGVAVFSWLARGSLARDLRDTAAREAVSDRTFNIYYFGESTMVGEPYAPHVSIPRLVEDMLGGRVAGRPVRTVNLAAPGVDLDWSLERIRDLVEQHRTSHPSLVVIYAGHNEFLKYDGPLVRRFSFLPRSYVDVAQRLDHLWTPLIDDRRFLDVAAVGAAERRAVTARFAAALAGGLTHLGAHGIPAIVSTVAGNVAEWEPNRSVYCERPNRDDFTRHFDRGRSLEAAGDLHGALAAYGNALALCDRVAEVHYRMGTCYRHIGERARAWEAFQRAIDEDGMPLRATSEMNDAIRRAADGRLVSSIDAVNRLRERSPDGLIGFDLMTDGHHPNLRGYVAIAELIAEEVHRRFGATDAPLVRMDEAAAAARFGIDARKRYEIAISRGRWFTKLATWRYDPRQRLELASERFREAQALDPGRCESHLGLGMVAFLRGDWEAGERYVAIARERNAEEVDRYLSERWVGSVRGRARRIAAQRPADGGGGMHGG